MILLVSLTLMSDLLQEIKNVKTTKWSVILKKKWPGTMWGKHEWGTHRVPGSLCWSLLNGIKLCPNLAELTPLMNHPWSRCSGICVLSICALAEWVQEQVTAGDSPQPSLMPGKGSPGSPRPLHPLPVVVWDMMETQLQNTQIPWSQGSQPPQGLQPWAGVTSDGFHNGQWPQNLFLS